MGKSSKIKFSRPKEIDDLLSNSTIGNQGGKGDQQILKELNSLPKKYKIKIITTSFFDTKENKDLTHVVVSSSGIFVINTEDDEGLAAVRISSSILRTATFQFLVGAEDKTDLINDIRNRVRLAESIISNYKLKNNMTVRGVLTLPYAKWNLFGRDNKIGGILLKGDKIHSIFLDLDKYGEEEIEEVYKILFERLI